MKRCRPHKGNLAKQCIYQRHNRCSRQNIGEQTKRERNRNRQITYDVDRRPYRPRLTQSLKYARYFLVLELIKVNQGKRNNSQRKSNAIICRGRPQSQQAGNIADKNKYENRPDIVSEPDRLLSHYAAHHSVQHLNNHFHYILKRSRNFRGMLHRPVCRNTEACDDQHDDQNAHMGRGYPYRLPKQFIGKDPMNHKVHFRTLG